MSLDKELNKMLKDLTKDVENNLENYIEKGQVLGFKCTKCGKETKGKYLGNSKVKCSLCNEIINIDFKIQ